ncbi:exopolysaccharide biosynthesis polyprenyl glycosylphosphotransferase [Brevundimonas sp. S30B]|nr:exopolysaccharide biosynthesis polyprenyl glycosylphosphotransferase [Brevundimonas sp. MF30-B]TFW02272.1 exopolysaccharide biosynthesis polyprenyl glycosylphosphotransferase [Brevundimonas sp. S30B]
MKTTGAALREPSPSTARPSTSSPSAGRGPFRPAVWLNARQRGATRLAAHYFRAIDAAAVTAITVGAIWSASPTGLGEAPLLVALPFVGAGLVVIGLMRSFRLYRFRRDEPLLRRLAQIGGATLSAGLVGLVLAEAFEAELARAVLAWTGLAAATLTILHLGWATWTDRLRRSGALTPNVVVVGATRHAERLIREALKRRDLNVLGVFDDRLSRNPDAVEGVPVLGGADDLLTHRMTPYVDRIVLAIDHRAETRVRELTQRLSALPNEVTVLVDAQGDSERNAALEKLAEAPLSNLDAVDSERRAFHKRLQDVVIGAIALVLLAPVLAVVALAVRLDSPGPALFRQRRHGFNQEEIVVWKFRSMRTEAADATASRQVTADDDRVTRVGRFIRKTSLDELPQLLNVLRGEMSLVGPRPHAVGMKTGEVESARLVAEYAHRHRIKPGMTGWAAIKGSRGPLHTAAEVRRRVQLDIDYVERQSFWLDLWIMAVTVPVLLGDRAAQR